MPDLKWSTMKRRMCDECKRVADAWNVPVDYVKLEFSIGSEEPLETWAFSVRSPHNWPGYAHAIGDTFKEAADECIEQIGNRREQNGLRGRSKHAAYLDDASFEGTKK